MFSSLILIAMDCEGLLSIKSATNISNPHISQVGYNVPAVQTDPEARTYYIILPEVIPAGGGNWI